MRSLALCALLSGGCPPAPDSGDSVPPGPWDQPWPVAVTVDGQPLAEGSYAGIAPIWWVIDTGAARTFVDANLTSEGTGDVTVGPVTLEDVQVGLVDLSEAEAFIGWDLGGLAGQNFFDDRIVVVDYSASEAHFLDTLPEDPPPGSGVGEVGYLPYALPSSIPVAPVTAAGAGEVAVELIADTGSGVTILTESTFAAVDDGTLPRLAGYVWASNYGSDDAFITRIPRLEAGGAVAEGTWAVVVPDDHHLRVILEASGITSQGFLGYPFYRRFWTGVDGFARAYRFWPCADLSHEDPDEWHRAGIEPSWREGGFSVEMVFTPSSAASAGVQRGDRIVGLGDLDLATASADEVKRALRGPVGEGVHVSLDRDGTPLEADLTFQDLLPEI
jgi:hypothetical protein